MGALVACSAYLVGAAVNHVAFGSLLMRWIEVGVSCFVTTSLISWLLWLSASDRLFIQEKFGARLRFLAPNTPA
jgi:hypothetical protein